MYLFRILTVLSALPALITGDSLQDHITKLINDGRRNHAKNVQISNMNEVEFDDDLAKYALSLKSKCLSQEALIADKRYEVIGMDHKRKRGLENEQFRSFGETVLNNAGQAKIGLVYSPRCTNVTGYNYIFVMGPLSKMGPAKKGIPGSECDESRMYSDGLCVKRVRKVIYSLPILTEHEGRNSESLIKAINDGRLEYARKFNISNMNVLEPDGRAFEHAADLSDSCLGMEDLSKVNKSFEVVPLMVERFFDIEEVAEKFLNSPGQQFFGFSDHVRCEKGYQVIFVMGPVTNPIPAKLGVPGSKCSTDRVNYNGLCVKKYLFPTLPIIEDPTPDTVISLINNARRNFANVYNISNMNELEHDVALHALANNLSDSCLDEEILKADKRFEVVPVLPGIVEDVSGQIAIYLTAGFLFSNPKQLKIGYSEKKVCWKHRKEYTGVAVLGPLNTFDMEHTAKHGTSGSECDEGRVNRNGLCAKKQ